MVNDNFFGTIEVAFGLEALLPVQFLPPFVAYPNSVRMVAATTAIPPTPCAWP